MNAQANEQYVPEWLSAQLLESGMSIAELAKHAGYAARATAFELRLLRERPANQSFIQRLIRLADHIARGMVEPRDATYVTKEDWARLVASGMTYTQLARALQEFPGGTFNRRLRGELPASVTFRQKVRTLVASLKNGTVRPPSAPTPTPMTPNPGGHYAHSAEDYEPPLPPDPTDAPAGSAEKVAVMYARAAAGYALRHPNDNEMHAPIGSVAKLAAIFDAMAAEDLVYQEEEDDDA
jgi:lambda repressor-like predicted transcriptional regulator